MQQAVPSGTPGRDSTAADTVVLAEVGTKAERERVARWHRQFSDGAAAGPLVVYFPHSPDAWDGELLTRIGELLRGGADLLLLPVRVAWSGPNRLRDLVVAGIPRRPRARTQRALARRHPEGVEVIEAEPERVSELRAAWAEQGGAGEGEEFLRFVLRRAVLALERADVRMRGVQYRVPRLVREELAGSPRFAAQVRDLAENLGRDPTNVMNEALACLDEMVAGWSRLLMDCVPQLSRFMYRQGYDEQIVYNRDGAARLRSAFAKHPGVVLMSHRSNLDAGVAAVAMLENDLPRAHGLAGDNMGFWPIGAIVRRAGVIFIRRTMSDDAVYRHVLREYIGYLLEKRFNLQWAIEGTRSRTGKMMPPKLGLLAYAVAAYRSGRVDDVVLAPVSIAYDQLGEIGEFAAYASGTPKQKEGVDWLVKFARSQRRYYGRIYVNFAEPISIRDRLGPVDPNAPIDRNELPKLAFEVAWRINQATPITAAALLTLVLLGADGRALTMRQLRAELQDMLDFAEQRELPITVSARGMDTEDGILLALGDLEAHGVITALRGGRAPVWRIAADQQLAASFYRNSLVHFVLDASVAELALARVASADEGDPGLADPDTMFWEEVHALRDLLKFDFFFGGRAEFVATIEAHLALQDVRWREKLAVGPAGATELLANLRPLTAHIALRSFIEAYHVVADVLCADGGGTDQAALLDHCLAVSRQFQWQGKVTTAESVSRFLLSTGVQVAAHRGLLDLDPGVTERRQCYELELRDLLRRARTIQELSAHRIVQLINEV